MLKCRPPVLLRSTQSQIYSFHSQLTLGISLAIHTEMPTFRGRLAAIQSHNCSSRSQLCSRSVARSIILASRSLSLAWQRNPGERNQACKKAQDLAEESQGLGFEYSAKIVGTYGNPDGSIPFSVKFPTSYIYVS